MKCSTYTSCSTGHRRPREVFVDLCCVRHTHELFDRLHEASLSVRQPLVVFDIRMICSTVLQEAS